METCKLCKGAREIYHPHAEVPKLRCAKPCPRCAGSGNEPSWSESRGMWTMTMPGSGILLLVQRCNPDSGPNWWHVQVEHRPSLTIEGSLEQAQNAALGVLGAGV